jgi:threonine dehydratase
LDFPVVDRRLVLGQWKQGCGDHSPGVANRYRNGVFSITIQAGDRRVVLFEEKADIRGRWNQCASGRLLNESLAAGKPLRLARSPSIADGLASPTTSDLVVETVRRYVDDLVAVSDEEIRDAMRGLLERAKLLVKGAGAAAVAALLAGRTEWRSGRKVVAVLSGGNVDFARLQEVIGRGSGS